MPCPLSLLCAVGGEAPSPVVFPFLHNELMASFIIYCKLYCKLQEGQSNSLNDGESFHQPATSQRNTAQFLIKPADQQQYSFAAYPTVTYPPF